MADAVRERCKLCNGIPVNMIVTLDPSTNKWVRTFRYLLDGKSETEEGSFAEQSLPVIPFCGMGSGVGSGITPQHRYRKPAGTATAPARTRFDPVVPPKAATTKQVAAPRSNKRGGKSIPRSSIISGSPPPPPPSSSTCCYTTPTLTNSAVSTPPSHSPPPAQRSASITITVLNNLPSRPSSGKAVLPAAAPPSSLKQRVAGGTTATARNNSYKESSTDTTTTKGELAEFETRLQQQHDTLKAQARYTTHPWEDPIAPHLTKDQLIEKLQTRNQTLQTLSKAVNEWRYKYEQAVFHVKEAEHLADQLRQQVADVGYKSKAVAKGKTELEAANQQLRAEIERLTQHCAQLERAAVAKVRVFGFPAQKEVEAKLFVRPDLAAQIQLLRGAVQYFINIMEFPSEHHSIRCTSMQLLDTEPGNQSITAWIKLLLEKDSHGKKLVKSGWDIKTPSHNIVDIFLHVLNQVVPQKVSNAELRALTATTTAAEDDYKLQLVFDTLQTCKITAISSEDEILSPDHYYPRLVAFADLFQLFCDPTIMISQQLHHPVPLPTTSPHASQRTTPVSTPPSSAGVQRKRRPYSATTDHIPKLDVGDIETTKTVTDLLLGRFHSLLPNWLRWRTHGAMAHHNIETSMLSNLMALVSTQPKTPHDMMAKAIECQESGNHADALRWIDKAIKKSKFNNNTTLLDLYCAKGWILFSQQKPQLAIQQYSNAIELDKKFGKAYKGIADVLQYQVQQFDKALQSYDAALLYNYQHVDTYCNRAECLMKKEKWEAALQDLDKATILDKNNIRVKQNYDVARPIVQEKQRKEAELVIEKELAKLPTIAFAANEAKLDAEDVQGLNKVAEIMNQFPLIRLRVIGVTTKPKLIPLAESRAKICVEYIEAHGNITPGRMEQHGEAGNAKATKFEPL